MEKLYETIKQCKKIHFIGIGGISMSSLAAIAKSLGHTVTGSDDDNGSDTVKKLTDIGITVYSPLSADNIKDADAVVFTAAIHDDNPELMKARENGIPCLSRAVYLGFVMTEYNVRIGVSGTHGKSTTTAMIYEIFNSADTCPTVACGAVIPSLRSAYTLGSNEHFIYEACEYTDSFLHFNPTTALILNIELDHTDYFPNVETLTESFKKSLKNSDKVITLYDNEYCKEAVKGYGGEIIYISANDDSADYYPGNIVNYNGKYSFDVIRKGEFLTRLELSCYGKHNMVNALFAFASAYENGISAEYCKSGLEEFTGIDRRFQKMGQYKGSDVYVDYAHHPGEIKVTLETANDIKKGRVIVVFQSHTHTRTARFYDGFARELSNCDKTVIMPTFSAREAVNDTGITAEDIANMIPDGIYLDTTEKVIEYIKKNHVSGDTYIFMGAGNVNKLADKLIAEDK